MSAFNVGDRVLVAADADDCYFGREVEGTVVEADDFERENEYDDNRVLVSAPSPFGDMFGELHQWVRVSDLTALEPSTNN